MYGSLFLCLILVYLGPVKGIFHAKSILIYIKGFVFWINSQMLSLCGLWINNKHKGRIKHYFVTVEPKKRESSVGKKVLSLHGLHGLQSAWSAFWGDRKFSCNICGCCMVLLSFDRGFSLFHGGFMSLWYRQNFRTCDQKYRKSRKLEKISNTYQKICKLNLLKRYVERLLSNACYFQRHLV